MAMRKVGSTRKKTAKKTTHRRKRRVSGVGDIKGAAMTALALGAGALAARKLNEIAVGMSASVTPLLSGIGQVVVGYGLGKFVKGPFMDNFGKGMMANGVMVVGVDLLPASIISGVTNTLGYNISRMNGTGNIPMVSGIRKRIAGTGNIPAISGPQSRISAQLVPAPAQGIGRASVPSFSY